jgi:hypothetical protein
MAALNSKYRRGGRAWLTGVTLVAALFFAVFFVSASVAVVSGSPSGFESGDGNMTLEAASNGADWMCFKGATGFQTGTPPANCSSALVTSKALAKTDPDATTSDDSWVSGQKMDQACAQTTSSKNPPKDDFTNIASYSETLGSNFNLFLYGATIRHSANGTASENVELNQVAGSGNCPISRTQGDRLLAFDYLNGGTQLNLHVLTWVGSSAGFTDPVSNITFAGSCIVGNDTAPCWSSTVITPAAASFEGQASQAAITAANNPISGTALAAGQFAEFGVNLTSAFGQSTGSCTAFAQTTWESRSSGSSFTSNPTDITVEKTTVTNCGEVKIIKHTLPRGTDQNFSYSTNISSASGASATFSKTPDTTGSTTTFSLNDAGNSAGGDSSNNTEDVTNVFPGNYTVGETVPAGWTLDSSSSCSPSTGSNSGSFSGGTASISLASQGLVTCTFVNKPNTATLATSINAGPYLPAVAIHDTATVTGSVSTLNPSGNVTFYLCSFPSSDTTSVCDGTTNVGTSIGTGALGNGAGGVSTASSPTVNDSAQTGTRGTLSPGRYCFRAEWGGDTNYVTGTLKEYSLSTECFNVTKIDTTTVTTPNVAGVATTNITLTSSIRDTAVVTGTQAGGDPTGKVVFHVCAVASPNLCTGTSGDLVGPATGVDLVSDGVASTYTSSASSPTYTPTATGRYCFRADYLGSTVYNTSSDSRSTECFTVTDTTSVSSTQSWVPNDSASVQSANGAKLTGTLSLQLYTGNNCGVSSGTAQGSAYTATGNGTTTSLSVSSTNTTSYTGNMSWLVTFSSTDPNVASATSHCEFSNLSVTN